MNAEARRERATLREWIHGAQIDLLWRGRDPQWQKPRPMGAIREAENRGYERVLAMLDQRDREERT